MIKRGPPGRYPVGYPNYQPGYPRTRTTNNFPGNPNNPQPNNQDKKKNIDKTKILAIISIAVILAIIIAFIVIGIKAKNKPKLKENLEDLDNFNADLKISNVVLLNESNLAVEVQELDEQENLKSVIFVFYENEKEIMRRTIPFIELKEKDFNLSFRLRNTSKISEVSIIPVFIDKDGKNVEGEIEDEFVVERKNEVGKLPENPLENLSENRVVECNKSSQCDDSNICTANKCENGKCVYIAIPGCFPCNDDSQCEDHNPNTENVCLQGRCVYNLREIVNNSIKCSVNSDCNDDIPCTRDVCANEKCVYFTIDKCIHNDGCCPPGNICVSINDNDCAPVCGNNIIEGDEKCDGSDLDGKTCAELLGAGYTGNPACYKPGTPNECNYDTSGCVAPCSDTCESLGYECGTQKICGKNVVCGNYNGGCQAGYSCQANGKCTKNPCVPETCASLGRNCGTVSDGCGGTLTCGNYNGGCQTGYTCQTDRGFCVQNPPENIKYVSKTGVDSPSRDGSVGQEWASLSYACSRVKTAGHVIHVNPGNYVDNNRCDLEVGVSIEGDRNSPPTITTSYTHSVSKLHGYIELNSPSGNAVNGRQSISYINFDGNSKASYRAIAVNYRSNVEIHHCNFSYFRLSGVVFHGTTSSWNVEPQNIIPTGNQVHDCFFKSCANWHRTETSLWDPGHIRLEGQSGMKIYNNVFHQKDQAEGYNADIIVGYQNDGLKLYNNEFHKNDIEGDEWNFFYEMHYHRGGIEIYNNRFYGASTVDFSGTVKGNYDFGGKIYNNSFIANSIPPTNSRHQGYIDIETFTYVNDLYIYNNYFKNARIGIHINNAQISMNNIWVYNNIIEGVGNSDNSYSYGIVVESNWADNTPTPADNIYIYNNVVTAAKNTYAGVLISAGGDISNLNIRNNIIKGGFSYPIRINDRKLTTRINGLNINNNMFHGTSSSSIYYSSGLTYSNRNDNGNLANVDPLFVGGSPYNFRLSSSSPARGKGIYVGLDRDYAGQSWNNPPSIGAYEYK